eukprot:SAG11_NODE_1320_length_5208_cov_5.188687_4_plen_180_part_00
MHRADASVCGQAEGRAVASPHTRFDDGAPLCRCAVPGWARWAGPRWMCRGRRRPWSARLARRLPPRLATHWPLTFGGWRRVLSQRRQWAGARCTRLRWWRARRSTGWRRATPCHPQAKAAASSSASSVLGRRCVGTSRRRRTHRCFVVDLSSAALTQLLLFTPQNNGANFCAIDALKVH